MQIHFISISYIIFIFSSIIKSVHGAVSNYSYDIYYDIFGLNFGQFGQGHERVGRFQQPPALRLVVEGARV